MVSLPDGERRQIPVGAAWDRIAVNPAGTHALLIFDPEARPLLLWETQHPDPIEALAPGQPDPRYLAIKTWYEEAHQKNPEFTKMHYASADTPEECVLLQALSLDYSPAGAQELRAQNMPLATVDPAAVTDYAARQALLDQFGTRDLRGFGVEDNPLAIRAAGAALQYLFETQRTSLSM